MKLKLKKIGLKSNDTLKKKIKQKLHPNLNFEIYLGKEIFRGFKSK